MDLSSTKNIDSYYNLMETIYNEKFKKSKNGLYWIPKAVLPSVAYDSILFELSSAIEQKNFIGSGSYGSVSFCQVEGISRKCVMKTIKHAQLIDDLKAEVEVLDLASKCSYLPRMFYSGFKLSHIYMIIMECISGYTLAYHIRNSDITFNAAKVIAFQIFRGVEFLHKNGRTHGDLKPENIGLTEKGYVKLLDFGKSRKLPKKPCILPRGTITYEAPEIIERKEAGFPSDWWSFGCVVIELILKKPPFYHEDDEILAKMIINDEPNIQIQNREAKYFVTELLQKNPLKRPSNILREPFINKIHNVPIFVPGDVLSKIQNQPKPDENDYIFFQPNTDAENVINNTLLYRYPTKECAKFMN